VWRRWIEEAMEWRAGPGGGGRDGGGGGGGGCGAAADGGGPVSTRAGRIERLHERQHHGQRERLRGVPHV
jgi:hypothetical protein